MFNIMYEDSDVSVFLYMANVSLFLLPHIRDIAFSTIAEVVTHLDS